MKLRGANVNKRDSLRRRWTAALLLAATGFTAAACGSKAGGDKRHAQAAQPPEASRPTPDTTPIEALRTPAGLILKSGEAPAAVTPASQAPTPAPPAKPAS
jgi:hypothetical protein